MLTKDICWSIGLATVIWTVMPQIDCRHTTVHNESLNVNQLAAVNIVAYMDAAEKPCENFYQFVCGRWCQQHNDVLDYGNVLGMLDYELNKRIDNFLRKLSSFPHANTSEENTKGNREEVEMEKWPADSLLGKVSIYYQSCSQLSVYNMKMYLQLIQPAGDLPWYILAKQNASSWNTDSFDWLQLVSKLRLYGLNGVLLKENVLPRWDDTYSMSIYLDKPDLSQTIPMAEGMIIEMLMDLGETKKSANQIARQVHSFEVQLHKLQEIEDEDGAKEMQLSYLMDYMPQIDWLTYLKELKGPTTEPSTAVIIQNIPYMRSMVKLLNTVESSTLCNYIMLRFLLHLIEQGPAEISRQECISSLRRAMPLGMSYLIGKNLYRDAEKKDAQVQKIFQKLKNTLKNTIRRNRLHLPPLVVETQLQKVDYMQLRVGFSFRNYTLDDYSLHYTRAVLNTNNFYANQLSLLRLRVEHCHETLNGNVNHNLSFDEALLTVGWVGSSSSPLYIKSRNLLVVPYGFLQMPIFHRSLCDIFKYSTLGFALAHEMMHGFDSSGIDYDHFGNIMGPSEEISANKRFMQGLRCIQNQLTIGGRSLNEKIADYESIRLVYSTYFTTSLAQQPPSNDSLTPGTPFTDEQLFFIKFAQFFCGKVHPKLRQTAYLEHAIDELRVLQTLANFEEFSLAFNCNKQDKMQSRHRCLLW